MARKGDIRFSFPKERFEFKWNEVKAASRKMRHSNGMRLKEHADSMESWLTGMESHRLMSQEHLLEG